MKAVKLMLAGLVMGSGLVATAKPFGITELQEATRLVTAKFEKERGVALAEAAVSVTAQRTEKGATVTVLYEEAGKGLVFSLPCHQHKAGDIDCH